MTIESKRRIVWLGLVVLALWPPLHHAIFRRFDLSPWKGFGWAMYCVPPRVINTSPFSLDDRAPVSTARLNDPQRRAIYDAAGEFGRWRAEFGTLVKPDELADVILELYPQLMGVEITVERVAVDRASATFVPERMDRYQYRRER